MAFVLQKEVNEEDDKDESEQNEEYGQRAVVFIFGSPLFRKKDSLGWLSLKKGQNLLCEISVFEVEQARQRWLLLFSFYYLANNLQKNIWFEKY